MKRIAIVFAVIILAGVGCRKQIGTSQFQLGPKDVVATTMAKAESGSYTINVTLSDAASQRFTQLTKENLGKTLPLLVGGKVVSAPVVQEVITGPELTLPGSSKEDAERILDILTTK